MKNSTLFILSVIVLLSSCAKTTENGDKTQSDTKPIGTTYPNTSIKDHDLSMYPVTTEGTKRYVITLPKIENENHYKVEIWGGKKMNIDCNNHSMNGNFEEKYVEGWGYSYYNLNSDLQILSTLKACPDTTKHKVFVRTLNKLVRYNSKLPLVVYASESLKIKYTLWERNNIEKKAIVN